MALQEAKRQVTHAKIGCFGGTGSGKTTFVSQMAIALSKQHHNGAPVAFFSTEPGVDYVIPIFEKEAVKLYVERSKAFSDLLQTVKDAQKMGCCAVVVDSITHVWVELVDAFCREKRISKPEFQHWRIIKGNWGQWASMYVNSPLHILVAGRAGFEYEYEQDENGKKELVKGDSKMKAEGEFGYEADLLMELRAESDKQEMRAARGKRGQKPNHPTAPRMIHYGLVRKSRVWELNGKEFAWPDKDHYEAGDYKLVSGPIAPFLNFLNIGAKAGPVVDDTRTSEAMFAGENNGEYYRRQQQKNIALEDWDATMSLMFPGQDAASKKMRMLISQDIFAGIRSRTEIESQPVETLRYGAKLLRKLEERISGDKMPEKPEAIMAELEIARQVLHDEEASALADKAQPIVEVMDQPSEAEVAEAF